MIKIVHISIANDYLLEYIRKRQLEKQFNKALDFIIAGNFSNVDLKIRAPKEKREWYFRINKQFRAICDIEGETLYIKAIDNHSD